MRKPWVRRLLQLLLAGGLMLLLALGFYRALLFVLSPPAPVSALGLATKPAGLERPLRQIQVMRGTVLVSAVAEVSPAGAETVLTVTPADCTPAVKAGPLRLLVSTGPESEPSLNLSVDESVCLSVDADALAIAPAQLTGVWRSAAADELIDFDNSVTQWRYTGLNGQASYLTLVAAGYCNTDEGDCSAAISWTETSSPEAFFLRLNLPDSGVSPLSWSAH